MGGTSRHYILDPREPAPDRLPHAALIALAEEGLVIQTEGFIDFMRPDVHWIEPCEFGEAFMDFLDDVSTDWTPTPAGTDHLAKLTIAELEAWSMTHTEMPTPEEVQEIIGRRAARG